MKKFSILLGIFFFIYSPIISQSCKDSVLIECIYNHINFLIKENTFINENSCYYVEGVNLSSQLIKNSPCIIYLSDQIKRKKTKRGDFFYIMEVTYNEKNKLGTLTIVDFLIKRRKRKYSYVNNGGSEFEIKFDNDRCISSKLSQGRF